MTRRRSSARGLVNAQTAFAEFDDSTPSEKPCTSRQARHCASGRGGNFELKAVKEVQDIFQGIVDDDMIFSVLDSCNYDAERATTLLCELTSAEPPSRAEQGYQLARSNSSTSIEAYSGLCLWDFLPMECRLQVTFLLVILQSTCSLPEGLISPCASFSTY